MASNEELLERLRKSLTSAKYALDEPQLEAALGGVERLLANNLAPLSRAFAPFVPQKSDEVEKLIHEKYEIKQQLTDAHAQIAVLHTETSQLRTAIVRHEVAARNWDAERSRLNRRIIKLQNGGDDFDWDAIRQELDGILEDERITPSVAMAAILKEPDLKNKLEYLPPPLMEEIGKCSLSAATFVACRAAFGPNRKIGATKAFVAMFNNLPLDFDERIKPYKSLLHGATASWRGTKHSRPPWVAFVIRCGVMQANLKRLAAEQDRASVREEAERVHENS